MLWRPSGPLCYKVKDDMLSIQRRSKIYFGRKQKGQESCFAVGGGRVREVLDTGLLGGGSLSSVEEKDRENNDVRCRAVFLAARERGLGGPSVKGDAFTDGRTFCVAKNSDARVFEDEMEGGGGRW